MANTLSLYLRIPRSSCFLISKRKSGRIGLVAPIYSEYLRGLKTGYVYYVNRSGDSSTYSRIKLGANKPELVVDVGNLHLYSFMIGLTPDGSALFTRDLSADEIYSLDVELP